MTGSRVEVPPESQGREVVAGFLSGLLVGSAILLGLVLTNSSVESRLGGLVTLGVSVVMLAVGAGGPRLIRRTHVGPALRGTIEGACYAIGGIGVLGFMTGALDALFGPSGPVPM